MGGSKCCKIRKVKKLKSLGANKTMFPQGLDFRGIKLCFHYLKEWLFPHGTHAF